MATSRQFSYEGLFAKNAPATVSGGFDHPKYDFAVAYPNPDTLPLDDLAESLKAALEREGKDLAYYPSAAGLLELRELVAEKLTRKRNMKVSAQDIILTAGSGEAIAMLIQAFTDPGDVALVEEYFYLGTMRQMNRFGADPVGVKCDNEGIIPQELDATIERLRDQGRRVKYLYTIPTFQNPLGWTTTLERRRQILEVTKRHGVPIWEDDCYVDLRFEGEDVTSFHSLDDSGQVTYLGSFSKIIAPGMRMGYVVGTEEVLQRARSFKGGGGVNQFAAITIAEYMKRGMDGHIDEHNRSLMAKRDAMLAALGEGFGDAAKWSKPEGGLYIWLEMPEGTDLAGLQEKIWEEGVSYYNGTMFSPEGLGANRARLCFGHPSAETVYDGVTELARLLERHGALGG